MNRQPAIMGLIRQKNLQDMTEKIISFFSKSNYYLTLLLVFSLPILENKLSALIVLWVLSFLFHKILSRNHQFNFSLQLALLPTLYALYVIGLLWSVDKRAGLFTLEIKLSLLVFPIVIAGATDFFKGNQLKILYSFISGCVFGSVVCILIAFYKSVNFTPDGFHFNSIDPEMATWDFGGSYFRFIGLSVFLHPTYFSAYLLFALTGIVEILKTKIITSVKLKYGLYASIFLFLVMIYLLSSKTVILCTIFLLIVYTIAVINHRKNRILKISIAVMVGILVFVALQNPRFSTLCKLLANPKMVTDNSSDGSIVSRIHIWKSGVELVGSNFLKGVGPGDTNIELVKRYQLHHFKDPFRIRANAHNQFLETFIDLGFPGFMLLLAIFVISFRKSVTDKNTLQFIFLYICCLCFLFESMLCVREGIVFFCFFFSFLTVTDIHTFQRKSILKPDAT